MDQLPEVDDLKAAVDYLCKLPQVDKKNIFAVGHSVGGTNVVLLSEIDSRLKKVAACGAYADFDRGVYYEQLRPYEKVDKEHQLRSFGMWTSDLHCPVLFCFGGNDPVEKAYSVQAQDMQVEAEKHKKQVRVELLPGYDHFQAFLPSLNKIVPFFEEK
ncbi:MAG: dienelactone hydrolase family protein [Leptolyngbya sp.]|nr:dienelactone hydrolase family protein [Candidatus Melainabacteria bacterium]